MGQNLPTRIVDHKNPKENIELKGYRVNRLRSTFAYLALFLTLGLLYILLAWRKDIRMWMFYEECPLQHATKILCKDTYGQYWVEDVVEQKIGNQPMQPKTRYFINKQVKYVWDVNMLQFIRFGIFDVGMTCSKFHENPGGLSDFEIDEKRQQYGTNFIRIDILPAYKLAMKEISNPFYLVQLYTVVVWMAQEYFDYSAMVIGATLVAVGAAVRETRKQLIYLRKKVHVAGSVTVVRGGVEKKILSQNLVPGDILCINPLEDRIPFHCDAVLIEGTCSVDESMLTGESRPITKIPVPDNDETFDYNVHSRHVLYNGTQLLQGRAQSNHTFLKAIVIRTGYMTSKGELIRAILFPKPIHFRFYTDLLKVAGLFCVIGLAGMAYSIYVWIRNGGSTKDIVLNSLDIITFVVPPLLPAALTSISAFAQRRLLNRNIYCLSSKHISLCGGVDVVCFDKTGTLTETDVDLAGLVPISEKEFGEPMEALSSTNVPLTTSLATCHSLIKVKGKLVGYSVDKKMFESTGFELEDGPPGVNPTYGVETPFIVKSNASEVAVLLRFPFEASVKRMTVVTQKQHSERYNVFIKGAPEIVSQRCNAQSVPSDFELVLKHYTLQGYRVLALAYKTLTRTWSEVQKMTREDLENNSEMLGLLVLKNKLKEETLPSIRVLHGADIQTVMVTGDNLQTAVTVAKECEIIDRKKKVIQIEAALIPASLNAAQHLQVEFVDPMIAPEFLGHMSKMRDVHNGNYCFAIDGPSFELLRTHDPALLSKCIHRGKVFARMAPEHKQHLIESLQRLGRQVAMVGDGCNDCAALRTADAGISLSVTEASVAAPFTSQVTNISCVAPLIREGRTTLDAAFGTFQFAIAVCFIFFVGVLMCYSISTEPSDFQYVIWDFGIVLVPFFTIGNVSPPRYLHPRRPLRHLWAFLPMFSFFTFVIWQSLVLTIGWFYCHAQPWFQPYVFEVHKRPPNPSYEETTLIILMYIGSAAAAFVFSPNPPYSRNVFSNRVFVVWSFLMSGLLLCVMFIPDGDWVSWLNFKPPPSWEYTGVILILGVSGGLVCYCWEKFLVRGLMYQRLWPKLNCIRPTRHLYQTIETELNLRTDWPEMGRVKNIRRLKVNSLASGSVPTTPTDFRGSTISSWEHQSIKITRTPSNVKDWRKNTFKTFHSSRNKGSYNPSEANAPQMDHEHIRMSEMFPPPPDDLYGDDVQVVSVRPFDGEEGAVQQPAFDSGIRDASPLLNRQGTFKFESERVDADVELVGYRPVRRLSDYSPSQQRRHLNGGGPDPS